MGRKATGKPFAKGDKRAGRPKGRENNATLEAREFCRNLLASPAYQDNLRKRLEAGKLAPAVEALMWAYGYGKPKDQLEVTGKDGAPLVPITRIETVIVDGPDTQD
jgi:hypothetical protein